MDFQEVLSVVAYAVTPRDHAVEPVSLWRDVRLAPAYIAGLSVTVVILQSTFGAIRAILADTRAGDTSALAPARCVRAHILAHGGETIFAFKLLRTAFVFALLGLHAADLARDTSTLATVLFFTYLYASGLAFLNVAAAGPLARTATPHLVLILLGSCSVYGFRDVWPLMTYTMRPVDAAEGATLWAKVALLALAGIAIPLTVPRQYVPIDPENPSEKPNPEQTCSILSLVTYTFLDQPIFAVKRAPLQNEQHIPPIADYDRTMHLVARSFKRLDVFSGARRQHMFIGLMKVFGWEYATMGVLVALRAVTGLFAPIGINRLLSYIESGGQDALVQPWVWCFLMFLGPFVGTLIMQYYIFLSAGTFVRGEGIITQLVFEHALRMRVKSEAVATTLTPSTAATPETASLVGTDADTTVESGAKESSHAGEASTATAVSGTGSTQSDVKKDGVADGKKDGKKDENKDSGNFAGKINNLVTTDLQTIVNACDFMMLFVHAPVAMAFSMYFLYLVLGWSAFVGLASMIVCLPVPGYLASLLQTVQKDLMQKTDARVQTVTEMMGVLRMIKMFGWEGKIAERLSEKRTEELKRLKKSQLIGLGTDAVTLVIPIFQMVATYGTFTLVMGRPLTPSIVFPSMSVFTILRSLVGMFFYYATPIIKAKVSLDRITEYLRDTELLDRYTSAQKNDASDVATLAPASGPADSSTLGIRDASFTWSAASADGTATPTRRTFTLRINDELTFKRGAVNLIVGPTGSGKTSLLMALLGEMHCVPFTSDAWVSLPRAGGVAYAAQESWVQNETIRDNILFGAPYDETRYKTVIYQCGLKRDLSLLDAGDKTEVGEKGLTLSGGQKARVTLARAIYSSADIILLDDVLAALDVHTAKWIVEKCLKGSLVRGRTVVLVTHNVALAGPIADFVVSLGTDGTIAASGSYREVLSKDETIAQEAAKDEEILTKADEDVQEPETLDEPETKSDGKLIVAEEVAEGHVSLRALKLFWSILGGKHPLLFWTAFLGGRIMYHIFVSSQSFFLGRWADAYTRPGEVDVVYYLTGFTALVLVSIVFFSISQVTYVFGLIRAAKKLHALLMDSILGTTLRWLDTTPTSRVITRCTKDVKSIDSQFSSEFEYLVRISTQLIVQLIAIAIVVPAVVVPGLVIFLAGAWLGNIYIQSQLPVKRVMSNKKAPVLGHFGAAMAGLTSIRAYGAEDAFRAESYKRIESYTRSARVFYNLNRWISIRSDFLAGIFSASLGAYMVYGPAASVIGASNVGFALAMAAAFSGTILWLVRIYNEFEIEGNSLERIQQYMEIEQEPKPTKEKLPPAAWPASGSLRVEGLSARYSPDGLMVLHDLSFTVNSGERVGIVGRTGSGKSSLTLSLLRCIYTDGAVYYDGVDTASLNLDVLRTNVTIIPQVPELLSGTLRENLDPFGEHDDAVLNGALRASGLFSLQSATDEGRITLDSQIAGGGSNLSVGQRQILALARALVRGSKLLILDEATSSIDYETDSIIQSSLRNELGGDVTLLTVAHRLQTIMDADKIMVLDAGRIVEFDSPKTLLEKEGGFLKSLVDESGDKDALYAMAGGAPS